MESTITPRQAGGAHDRGDGDDGSLDGEHPLGPTPPPAGGALVPRPDQTPEAAAEPADPPSMAEVLDLALLDRLLGAEEEKTIAAVEAAHAQTALDALAEEHERTTSELEVERQEHLASADRYRQERTARIVADAKVAELRERVAREMAIAESQKQARAEATARWLAAEREAAHALASMGWLARRRFRRAGPTG